MRTPYSPPLGSRRDSAVRPVPELRLLGGGWHARWTVLVSHTRNGGKQAGRLWETDSPPPSKTPSVSSRSLTKQAHREGAGGLPFLLLMAALALLHILGVAEALYRTMRTPHSPPLGSSRDSATRPALELRLRSLGGGWHARWTVLVYPTRNGGKQAGRLWETSPPPPL